MARRKTWQEKFESGREPHVEVITKPFCGAPAGAKMLVSAPYQVRDFISSIPLGEVRTSAELRQGLASKAGADIACPTSTGIFVRIAAEVALEEIREGADPAEVTPFWRVVDPESPAATKISCGPDFIREMRKKETTSP